RPSWPDIARRKTRVNALICPGHPRRHFSTRSKTWMPGPRPDMTTSMSCPVSCLINRKPTDQRLHPRPHCTFDQCVLLGALPRKRVEHLGDHVANLLELGDAETARGAGRRAEPHA